MSGAGPYTINRQFRAVNMVRDHSDDQQVGETDVAFSGANTFRGVQFDVADLKTSEPWRAGGFKTPARAAGAVSLMDGTWAR
jgi:hypothetical protein